MGQKQSKKFNRSNPEERLESTAKLKNVRKRWVFRSRDRCDKLIGQCQQTAVLDQNRDESGIRMATFRKADVEVVSQSMKSQGRTFTWRIRNFGVLLALALSEEQNKTPAPGKSGRTGITSTPVIAALEFSLPFGAGSSGLNQSEWKIILRQDTLSSTSDLQIALGSFTKGLNVLGTFKVDLLDAKGCIYRSSENNPPTCKFDAKDTKFYGCTGLGSIANGTLKHAKTILVEDTLTLRIEMMFYSSKISQQINYSGPGFSCTEKDKKLVFSCQDEILHCLEKMFSEASDFYADVTFKFVKENVELKAHKAILCARSPVFEAMFASNLSEASTGIVTITDMSSEAMKIVLRFIYSGLLPYGSGLGLSSGTATWKQVAAEVMYASEKYNLSKLMEFCNQNLAKACDGQNTLPLLDVARTFNLKQAEGEIIRLFLKPKTN